METALTQLGVGGILVILVLKEVFGFLKNRNGKSCDTINRMEFDRHKGSVQYKDNCEVKHEGLNQTIEAKFDGMAKLMEQQFKDLGNLVKNNGHD